MKTIGAIIVSVVFIALSPIFASIVMMVMVMGVAGAPGAIIYETGAKYKDRILKTVGLFVSAVGQSYLAGAYSIFCC